MFRRALNYKGEGDYWSRIQSLGRKYIPTGAFSSAGEHLGGIAGGGLGSQVGAWAGKKLSNLVGFGDYDAPVSNQIVAGGMGSGVTVNASDDLTGDVYLSHKEFVGNVTASHTGAGSSIFQQTKHELNPGLQASFPFLSQLATNFEMYDFMGLIYEYRPTSGENSTNNSLGKVMMATQYDPDATPWLNSVQLMNYDYSCSTKPSIGLVHGVETANKQQSVNMMYVRSNNDTTKSRIFTDIGTFTVATEGIPFTGAGTQILGELWVTYRIKLSRAALYQSMLGLSQPLDTFVAVSTVGSCMPAGAIKTRKTNAGLWNVTGSGTATIDVKANSSLIAGCYQYVLFINEPIAAKTVTGLTITVLNNCTAIDQPSFPGGIANATYTTKDATQNRAMMSGFISVNNTNNTQPWFRLNTTGTIAATAGILYTLTIGQVPCTIETDKMTE
jgi:hypothetical protein